MKSRLLPIALLSVMISACSGSPFAGGQEARIPGISIVVRAAPVTAAPGDTVRFVAVAHNQTNERVQLGGPCGPSLDVNVLRPDGIRISVLAEMVGPNGGFTCELGPYHFAEPRDSLINHMHWVAPAIPGVYVAVAGERRHTGLITLSAPVNIIVR